MSRARHSLQGSSSESARRLTTIRNTPRASWTQKPSPAVVLNQQMALLVLMGWVLVDLRQTTKNCRAEQMYSTMLGAPVLSINADQCSSFPNRYRSGPSPPTRQAPSSGIQHNRTWRLFSICKVSSQPLAHRASSTPARK